MCQLWAYLSPECFTSKKSLPDNFLHWQTCMESLVYIKMDAVKKTLWHHSLFMIWFNILFMGLFETWVSKSLHYIGNASNNSAGVAVSLKNDLLRTMHSRMGMEWVGFRIYSGPSRCEAFLLFPPEMSQKWLRFVRIVQSGSIFVHY